jgi:hypothetical protein
VETNARHAFPQTAVLDEVFRQPPHLLVEQVIGLVTSQRRI